MEQYATDTWYWKVKSYEGYSCNQIFFGCKSKKFCNFGMNSENSGPEALLDFFRQEGVPMSIRSDNSKMQTGYMWKQYLRRYNVKEQFIEPYNPQQNPAERAIGDLKEAIRKTFIDTGCHPRAWFRLAQHIIDIKNHTACESNNWRTPIEATTGNTPDISGLLFFKFWEKVYYYEPTSGTEKLGRWCGRATNYGDTMCYWILTDDTEKLIVRGTVRSAENTTRPNLTLSPELEVNEQKGEMEDPLQQNSAHNFPIDHSGDLNYLNTEELLNMSFDNPTNVEIKVEDVEEAIEQGEEDNIANRTYNEVLEHSNKDDQEEADRWYFDTILSHRINDNGQVQLKIKWTGYDQPTWEPLRVIWEDDPNSVREYAQKRNLLTKMEIC